MPIAAARMWVGHLGGRALAHLLGFGDHALSHNAILHRHGLRQVRSQHRDGKTEGSNRINSLAKLGQRRVIGALPCMAEYNGASEYSGASWTRLAFPP